MRYYCFHSQKDNFLHRHCLGSCLTPAACEGQPLHADRTTRTTSNMSPITHLNQNRLDLVAAESSSRIDYSLVILLASSAHTGCLAVGSILLLAADRLIQDVHNELNKSPINDME